MNKLRIVSLFAILCSTAYTHALDKNDLEKAIRSFDVEAVKHIIATETFTQTECPRYFSLAEEVVSERKLWVWRAGFSENSYVDDTTTPFNSSKGKLAILECITGTYMGVFSGLALWNDASIPEGLRDIITGYSIRTKSFLAASVLLGATLFIKSIYDARKYKQALWEHKQLLRKKYDDAVTIKQILFSARVQSV